MKNLKRKPEIKETKGSRIIENSIPTFNQLLHKRPILPFGSRVVVLTHAQTSSIGGVQPSGNQTRLNTPEHA